VPANEKRDKEPQSPVEPAEGSRETVEEDLEQKSGGGNEEEDHD
jgi:hypothetical protein